MCRPPKWWVQNDRGTPKMVGLGVSFLRGTAKMMGLSVSFLSDGGLSAPFLRGTPNPQNGGFGCGVS